MRIRPPFKIHGGKFYLADWVIGHFPTTYEAMEYSEPFCGAASVFFNKKPSVVMEYINDLDFGVYDILRNIKDAGYSLYHDLIEIPYCLESFEKARCNGFRPQSINEYVL